MSDQAGKPRIVHVLDRFSIGGMESVALTLIEQTGERYEHRILCLRSEGDLAPRAVALGVPVESIDKQPGKDPAAYRRLRRRLRELAPDIVHTYNIGALDVALWARLAGVRRVIHAEHGRDVSDPTGSNIKYRWLRRLMAPMISVFVPVSGDLERWLVEDVRIPRRRVQLIRNGIDTERYSAARKPSVSGEANALHIGSVGRLDRVKGFPMLVEAFARLRAARPDTPMRLTIVGDGPARAEIEHTVAEQGQQAHVSLAGSRDDIPDFLQTLDIYVCSSIAEGIALTVLEAMAAGRAIVATAVGGNPELIEPGQTGVLVPSQDPAALADAVGELMDNGERARALARGARQRVCERFSVSAMIDNYCGLYDRLLERDRTH